MRPNEDKIITFAFLIWEGCELKNSLFLYVII